MTQQERDEEVLKKQREEREKTIQDLQFNLKKDHGFNSDSFAFGLKNMPNGPTLCIRTNEFNPKQLKDGWSYEPAWLLDKDYAQEGIKRQKADGSYEFIPISREESKSEIAVYRDATDIRDALLSVMDGITPDQIQIDEISGRDEIYIIGELFDNTTPMPAGLKYEDGCIIDVNSSANRKIEVKHITAHEHYNTTSLGDNRDRADGTLNENARDDQEKNTAEEQFTISDIDYMRFDDMKDVYENYTLDSQGNVVSKLKDDTYRLIESKQNNDPKLRKKLAFADCWANAYKRASSSENGEFAFGGETTNVDYNAAMQVVMMCRGTDIESVARGLFELFEFQNTGLIKTVLNFVYDPKISKMFEINTSGMTPDDAFNKVEALRHDLLKSEWSEMISDIRSNRDAALDELSLGGFVMEHEKKPQPNGQPNTGSTN